MTWPSIDHSLLSPNGRMSKRARKAAVDREARRLFPEGFFDKPKPSFNEQILQRAESLFRAAEELKCLALRGMCKRKYVREAAKMEAKAHELQAAYVLTIANTE